MNLEVLKNEIKYKAVRSTGPGGQHVNKSSSKVQLIFDVENSKAFSLEEKETLKKNLKSRLTKEHVLLLSNQETRSQHRNKELVTKKFYRIIRESLFIPKKRKTSRPTKSSVEKRIDKKKRLAYRKAMRRKPKFD